jgi:DNA polymerase-4
LAPAAVIADRWFALGEGRAAWYRMPASGFERRADLDDAGGSGGPSPAPRHRKILHIDMDAFYASVEQRDDPELRGKPVAVGGVSERGVVAAASYEARRFGIRSAMPSVTARRKCAELVFVKPRFDVYREISRQIRAIFADYTPLIEPLSLDEAYLDVSENRKGIPTATKIAEEIRARIRAETGLTASAGVSYNKFLAKMASGERKPDGMFVVTPRMGPAYVEALPIGRFHGIGPVTCAKMERLGIRCGADLKAQSLPFLEQHFGKIGPYFYALARGVDDRPVCADRVRKSIGAERTFGVDLFTLDEALEALAPLIDKVWSHCDESASRGRTVTLKAKYTDFEQITRSRTEPAAFASRAGVESAVLDLVAPLFPARKGVRLLGVTLSSFDDAEAPGKERQLRLAFGSPSPSVS